MALEVIIVRLCYACLVIFFCRCMQIIRCAGCAWLYSDRGRSAICVAAVPLYKEEVRQGEIKKTMCFILLCSCLLRIFADRNITELWRQNDRLYQ